MLQVSSKTNDKFLSKEQLILKVKALEKEKKVTATRIARLKTVVMENLKLEGLVIEDETSNIISEAIEKEQCPFDPETPQYLLWEQQKYQAGLKDNRGMRWHPLIIRWCLSIYLKSPTTYKHIRSSPFMFLPCKNTLLKYINFTDPGCGFNVDIINRLIKEIDIDNMMEYQKNVCIVFDEMRVKSGLVFCKTTGKLVGFTEMGDINDEMERYSRLCNKKEKELSEEKSNISKPEKEGEKDKHLAKYVIVFMVRGLFTRLCYPFGHYASEGFTSDQLYPCVLEAIDIIESIGLHVKALTADGASPNRKFFRIHKFNDGGNVGRHGVVYWTWNICCLFKETRMIYFVCDQPHLVKTSRNNIENSHGNKKTRNLLVSLLMTYQTGHISKLAMVEEWVHFLDLCMMGI